MSFYENLLKSTTGKATASKLSTASANVGMSKVTKSASGYDLSEISPTNIPLGFAKAYLRVDHDLDDIEISVCIQSAISYVLTYIKADESEDLAYELITPILSLIAYFYECKSPQMKSTEKLDTIFGTMLNIHRKDIL